MSVPGAGAGDRENARNGRESQFRGGCSNIVTVSRFGQYGEREGRGGC